MIMTLFFCRRAYHFVALILLSSYTAKCASFQMSPDNSFPSYKKRQAIECRYRFCQPPQKVTRLSLGTIGQGLSERNDYHKTSDRLKTEQQPNNSTRSDGENINQNIPPLDVLERDITYVIKELTSEDDPSIYPPIFNSSPLTITRLWNLDLWTRSTSRTRYIRFLWNIFASRLLKRIWPQLLTCTLWSIICVNTLTTRVKTVNTHFVPLTALSLVSTFIGFLITLRSNQSLDRLGEARQLWGRLFIVTRDTAQMLMTYVYSKDTKLGIKAARHLSLFAWLLKDRLRGTNREDIILTMLNEPSSDIYTTTNSTSTSSIDLAFLMSQRKRPAAAIARIRQVVADLAARNVLPYAPHQLLEQNLNEMNYILGMCERLSASPIPPVYTSHTSRLLVFYLVFLPLGLHGAQVKKLITVITTTMVSYAMLGLDEISHVLEQPFRLMPLQELSRNIMMDVGDAFVCQPPTFEKSDLSIKEETFVYPFNDDNRPQPSYW